jgi:hypothetical protein
LAGVRCERCCALDLGLRVETTGRGRVEARLAGLTRSLLR